MTKVRGLPLVVLAALTAMSGAAGDVDAEDAPPTIVTLGDSYINSFGVDADESFATRLKSELDAAGHPVTIVEVGNKGTSKRGLAWLRDSEEGLALQASPANTVVVLELGQNDCARIDLEHTRDNLDQMLGIFAEKRIPVLVVGTAAYPRCGAAYAEPYSQMFPELATRHGNLLYADFKEGVTGHRELLQADHDHPNAAGDAVIARNMLPAIEALLGELQRH